MIRESYKTSEQVRKALGEELRRQRNIYESLKWQLAERDKKVRFLEHCLEDIKGYEKKSEGNLMRVQLTPAYFHKEMRQIKYGRRRRGPREESPVKGVPNPEGVKTKEE